MAIPASDQQIRRLALLAHLLENDAVELGFLGPNEGQRVVSRHLLESAALVPLLIRDGPVIDVGSGAGLPGLVLGAMGADVILIEAQAKRADFLRSAGEAIGVEADVRHARAEDMGRGELRDRAGTVVARALAAPPVAFELCLPLARPGGRLLLAASPDVDARDADTPTDRPSRGSAGETGRDDEVTAQRERVQADGGRAGSVGPEETEVGHSTPRSGPAVPGALAAVAEMLGAADPRWQELSVPGAGSPRWVMMVDKRRPTPERFPRRTGVPRRRPLGGDVASVN